MQRINRKSGKKKKRGEVRFVLGAIFGQVDRAFLSRWDRSTCDDIDGSAHRDVAQTSGWNVFDGERERMRDSGR